MDKIRTIITQDAEVDDQNSLRHFLFYTNEVDLQGIVQTSSKFHHQGTKEIPPHRWTGTDWMFKEIDEYEKDYPNLVVHSPDYPTPDYLRSITKIGNISNVSEMEEDSEGASLIKERILDDDPRKLYIQVWGGTNTIAKALKDIEVQYKGTDKWNDLYNKISHKVVLTACGQQDDTYKDYIAESWPQIAFVHAMMMGSYAYAWFRMPEGDSKDTLRSQFMKEEILTGKSHLVKDYCTWLDGHYYEGEEENSQFGGSVKNIVDTWFGAKFFNHPSIDQYDFLSEGDSPTFFCLLNWGLRTLEDFTYGGFSGRYVLANDEFNSKGEALNYYKPVNDNYLSRDGKVYLTESMYRYVADIQRDFACRIDWASKDKYEDAEHQPTLSIEEGVDLNVAPNTTVTLHADSNAKVSFEIYQDASSDCSKDVIMNVQENVAEVTIPDEAKSGDLIHIIVQAKASGHYKLTHYQQVIIHVK